MKSSLKGPVLVMVTIDTEEDNWGTYFQDGASLASIDRLEELRPLWERYGVRPTYFVNHPPMANRHSAEILAELAAGGAGELGVHCHPWNSPPFKKSFEPPVTMMNRLSDEENHGKLAHLTGLFTDVFQFRPRSFRAGRWGLGPSVARPLSLLGYEVDASVSPFMDWSADGGPDFSRALQIPYRFDPNDPLSPELEGSLVEVPTSIGFLWGPQRLSASTRAILERSPAARLKIVGLLDVFGPLTKRWLSPETSTTREMIRLTKALVRSGVRALDFTFHSPSLLPGATPFVKSEEGRVRFIQRIRSFLEFCSQQGFEFLTITEVAEAVTAGEAL